MRATVITLCAYIDGKWREERYNTSDPSWREAFKILKAATVPVRILYSTPAQL